MNAWIRAGGDGAFDAVADFDQAVPPGPAVPRLLPGFGDGDQLHPGDEGNRARAAAVPLDRL